MERREDADHRDHIECLRHFLKWDILLPGAEIHPDGKLLDFANAVGERHSDSFMKPQIELVIENVFIVCSS